MAISHIELNIILKFHPAENRIDFKGMPETFGEFLETL
jgi:hypothetical protein